MLSNELTTYNLNHFYISVNKILILFSINNIQISTGKGDLMYQLNASLQFKPFQNVHKKKGPPVSQSW